jgi:hypothetical protein
VPPNSSPLTQRRGSDGPQPRKRPMMEAESVPVRTPFARLPSATASVLHARATLHPAAGQGPRRLLP